MWRPLRFRILKSSRLGADKYYFCKGVAPSSRRLACNMGKYMMKGKGVGRMAGMEGSQGSLGVRTRARRARSSEEDCKTSKASSATESLTQSHLSECNESRDIYMELRSRRLEKVRRCSIEEEDDVAHSARGLQKSLSECSRPSDSSSSGHGFSRPASAGGSDTSHSMPVQVPLESNVQGSVSTSVIRRRVTPIAALSRSKSDSISQRAPSGILTRNQRQELVNIESMEVDTEVAFPRETGPLFEREVEVERGESARIAELSAKDSQVSHGAEIGREEIQESTPDSSYMPNVEGPGSTSRTQLPARRRSISAPPFGRADRAPSSNEIEAFLEDAEQRERRRFMERYNFDPLHDTPLRGRYDWIRM